MELNIPTIVCEGCIETITKALKELDPQAQISANLASKTITIETTASPDAVRSAIINTGHNPK